VSPVRADASIRGDVPEDIAVIGLACLFPGAPDIGAFWRNIMAKVDAVTDPPHEAWDPALYYDANAEENDRVYCRKGGYLGPLAYFDPLEHGIMPRAAHGGEPDQWLALRVAREALRDAGCLDASSYRERAALILGKGTYANRGTLSVVQHGLMVDYTLGLLKSIHPELTDGDLGLIRADLKRHLPRFDAETAPSLIPNVTVGRIANRLDIMGPSYTVDAACASSLVAIDIAVKGLRQGEYDLALVGGLQAATALPVLGLFCQLKALSPTERIRPFDKDADGTVLSEGIGMAVLKRRSQAERDGDRVYACIKGTGVASDGRAVGVLAPRVEGEQLALERAYAAARVDPSTVGLIEAHGTGTLVGDAVEVDALARLFGQRVRAPHCALGSVKSMIGHTMPAAGIAGFIKAVLALHHKVLPPTINVTEPSPRLALERSPFYLNTETRPWIHGDPVHPRRAGINAFGFGGINAHVVVEEAPAAPQSATLDTDWDSEVCLFSGSSREEVIALGRRVAAVLMRKPSPPLVDVAFSLNTTRHAAAGCTLAIVARTSDDLARKLDRALTRLADPATRKIKDAGGIYYVDDPLARTGKIAFVFPGEGAQYVNMLSDLCRHFPVVRESFDAMDRVLFNHPRGYRLSEFVFPPPAFSEGEHAAAERRLWQMDAAVESVIAANQALYTLLGHLGIRPDAILGHSSGEFAAMRAAGMLDEDHYDQRIVELNDEHGRAAGAGELPSDARLIAVGASRERVESLCASIGLDVCVAMDNCPHQVVVVAGAATAPLIESRLREQGLLYELLSFDRPYHTPYFEPFAQSLRQVLKLWIVRPPAIPLYSCTSGALYPSSLAEAHALAYEHWIRPVEFNRTIRRMWEDGVRIFVEAGPRGNLTAFIEDVLADRPCAAVAANVSRRSGLTQLHHLIAQLAAHGVSVALEPLYARRNPVMVEWAPQAGQPARARSLGRVKLPTGAQDMGLSPETIELIRSRTRPSKPTATTAVPPQTPTHVAAPPTDAVAAAPPVAPRSTKSSRTTSAAHPPGNGFHQLETVATRGIGAPAVMSSFLHTMNRFLAVEHAALNRTALEAPGSPAPAVPGHGIGGSRPSIPSADAAPLIERVAGGDGSPLKARAILDLDRQPFLRDHTLGRHVSNDDARLTGFPLVPFTLLMELMAEAAAMVKPQGKVVGLREVRVHRWLAVDRGPLNLGLSAAISREGEIRVQIEDVDAPDAGAVAQGVVLVGERYPAPPRPESLALEHEQTYKWPSARLYDEAMFHGPLFRGVRSIDRVGDDGAEATLTVVPREALDASASAGGFATDFVLLDQPGQVVGFWTSQYLERGFVVLPFRMETLDLYGPPLPPGQQLTCRARIALVGDQQVRSDLDVLLPDGRLWARFEGWEDRRFDLPPAAFRALLEPASARLARPWPLGRDDTHGVVTFRIGLDAFPPGWLHAHGGMWSRVLGALVLSRRERAIWYGLQGPERRRLEWLLGRIAAKDAVRDHVLRRFDLALLPADVEILPDDSGRPIVGGSWISRLPRVPLVSISHVEGTAIAVVSDGETTSGVGVDLERTGRMKAGMETLSFDARERQILEGLEAHERDGWALRLWCAKEASSKATGCRVSPMSPALGVESIQRERGMVVLRCASPDAGTLTLSASTACEGDWIVATCVR